MAQQLEDLQKAGKRIGSLFEGVLVEAYFAWKRPDGLIEFERAP